MFLLAGDRRIAKPVRVIAVEDHTARILRNGVVEVVDLDLLGDPRAIRRRVNGDNWFTRLLDRISSI